MKESIIAPFLSLSLVWLAEISFRSEVGKHTLDPNARQSLSSISSNAMLRFPFVKLGSVEEKIQIYFTFHKVYFWLRQALSQQVQYCYFKCTIPQQR